MKTFILLTLTLVALITVAGCGAVKTITGGGGGGGTTDTLWPDVPALDGATKANMDLPLPARIAISAASGGKFDFIVYETSKTPQEVQDFYSADRMKSSGWQAQQDQSCLGGGDASGSGSMCVFSKNDNGKDLGLIIFIASDNSTKKTDIIYARVDTTELRTPTP